MWLIKLVVFDLDNVIIDGEAIDEIGKLVNVQDEIAEITEKAMNGDLDFETSIKERVSLLKGASVEDIKKVASEMKLTNGAADTLKTLKEEGYKIAIISGSFDIIVEPLKDTIDVDFIFTNTLVEEDGKLTGEVTGPLVTDSKFDVLSKLTEDNDILLNECVAIGDGANDISMIKAAELGIAFHGKPLVKEVADVVVEGDDLTAVIDVIKEYDNKDSESEVEEAVEEESTEEAANEEPAEEVEEESTEEEESEEETVAEESTEDGTDDEGSTEEAVDTDSKDDEKSDEGSDDKKSKDSKSKKDSKKGKKGKKSRKRERKELPKTDFVASDDPKKAREEKDEREELITKIAAERDEFNKIARKHRELRDKLNQSLKENIKLAVEFRTNRDKINEEVEANKQLRDKVNKELGKLEFSSGKKEIIKLEKEIEKIDKIIETNVLDIKKENQLVKNANELRKKVTEFTVDEKAKEEAEKLRAESEKHHAKVVELSENAQEFHEQMLVFFRKTDGIRKEADEAHKLFIKAREDASAKHEEFKTVLSEIHVINEKLGLFRNKKRSSERQAIHKKNSEEKEKAEEIFERFKNGKKLTTEELLLLQKHNIGS